MKKERPREREVALELVELNHSVKATLSVAAELIVENAYAVIRVLYKIGTDDLKITSRGTKILVKINTVPQFLYLYKTTPQAYYFQTAPQVIELKDLGYE